MTIVCSINTIYWSTSTETPNLRKLPNRAENMVNCTGLFITNFVMFYCLCSKIIV